MLVFAMPRNIEWYRPVMTRQMLRVVVPCSLIVLTAALMIGAGVLYREGTASVLFVSAGTVFAIIGPGLAAWGVLKFLKHDVYLTVRTDGVLFHDSAGHDTVITWSQLDGAAAPDEGTLELAIEDRDTLVVHERFIGIANADLAARISAIQRKALLGVPLL